MDLSDFDYYRTIIHDLTGLALSQEKTFLVESRLLPVARKWGYGNLQSLGIALRAMPPHEMLEDIAAAMMNGETSFFRDQTPFTDLHDIVLPALLNTRRRKKSLHIWSCGSSTGQEAWSIAITIKEAMKTLPPLSGWRIEITATDLSIPALNIAAEARYNATDMQRGLTTPTMLQWFEPAGKDWRVKAELRKMVRFESFNLMHDEMPADRMFDIIFCRHVMDDFDDKSRSRAFARLSAPLAPDGFLILGPGENPAGLYEQFMPLPENPQVYVLADIPQQSDQDALAQ